MKKLIPFALFAATTLLVAPSFAAEGAGGSVEETEFGDVGTINIGADTALNLAYSSVKPGGGGASSSVTTFGMAVDGACFILPNVSVGARISYDYSNTPDGTDNRFGIMAVGGYNAWITPGSLSIWPQLGVGWYRSGSSTTQDYGTGTPTKYDFTNSNVQLEVFVPLLIHPVKHFHFGIGPYLDLDLTGSASTTVSGQTSSGDGAKATTIGLRGEIAGWL